MRTTWLAVLTLAASAAFGPLQALEAGDTMAAWKSASPEEKTRLVAELLKRTGRERQTSGILHCLDAASGVPGHAELPIRELVEACSKDGGEPV